jgi:multidrug efflux pump subunit AcrA (membrane-fusion protein)
VFAGKVSTVGGVVDARSRTFLVESEFPNGNGELRPGLFARVTLESATPGAAR